MNNDLISRSALLEKLAIRADKNYMDEDIELTIREDMHEVKDAPAVDAVEVVRCRDCKHWMKNVSGCTDFVGCCALAVYMVGATGYCVYGERRSDDGKVY